MGKSRNIRKPFNKKKQNINMIHPHIELIQAEINAFAEEIQTIDNIQKERELTAAEQSQKDIASACLEKYQATLTKLTDTAMVNKLRSYNDITLSKKHEAQTLFLLQFFYVVRLGQLGLFDLIEMASPKAMLDAITDICDQLVGASVYYATDLSPITKSRKSKQVFDILKKLETNSEDVIMNDISFKDIKALIQHIWNNTIHEKQVLEKVAIDESAVNEWAVIQFQSMVENGQEAKSIDQEDDNIAVQRDDNDDNEKQQSAKKENVENQEAETTCQQANKPIDDEPAAENEPVAIDRVEEKDNSKYPVGSEWDKQDDSEASLAVDEWNKKDIPDAPTYTEWDKKDTHEATASNEWKNITTNKRKSSRSTTKPNWKANSKSYNDSKTTAEEWDGNEQRGWDVIDNTVKGDAWDTAEQNAADNKNDDNWTATSNNSNDSSSNSSNDTPPQEQQQQNENDWTVSQPIATTDTQQVHTPPTSPKASDNIQQESNEPMYNSETNDNWRRRGIDDINSSRGRGSSHRGSYRGGRGGKLRGRGRGGSNNGRVNFRGRGRGRGRGADRDNEQ